jgi:redox-sensing transcriptional repressor
MAVKAHIAEGGGIIRGAEARIPEKIVARLSMYRRILRDDPEGMPDTVFSHRLAALTGGTAAQVRRDLMILGVTGSTSRGYDVRDLLQKIGQALDEPGGQNACLVGVGNLGRAILSYFETRHPRLTIRAAFDIDPAVTGRVIHGCRCRSVDTLEQVVRDEGITVGVITVPGDQAQGVADRLVQAGVTGLLNFAPRPVRAPHSVYVEDMDITASMEKVAYFARRR